MQPLQYDLRSRAVKDNSITNAAAARSNLDAAITMRSAETELQNTIELRATAKKTILKHFLKGFLEGKSLAPKWRKSADKSLWQPSCSHSNTIYEVQLQKSITNAATARSNLDAATTMRSAETELQNTIELRATASEIVAPTPCVDRTCTKHRWNPIYNAEPIRPWSEHDPTTHETVSHPSHRRGRSSRFGDGLCMEKHRVSCICYLSKTHFVRDFLQNSIGNSSTSTTCNPICIAGTILQLQITMEFHRQISATHPPAPLAIPFTLRERSYSCKSQWNSVDRTCTKHRWNPIYNAEPIRTWSAHDPNMIRPHTRPSRTRRTAEVDHRGSGTDFVWKNIGFRASAISQKRISCETSFKTPSATPPPAPLAMPFALRERSYSCKSQWNSIGNSSTSTTCNPIYIAGTILQLQITMECCRPHMHETQVKPHLQCGTDPNMIRPWSDHTRDRLAPVAPQR